ncbi:MAG: SRPBCC family protein [Chthoniobacter sp.]|nr:SRPBCC family protein [Chthoniobacter sp.]
MIKKILLGLAAIIALVLLVAAFKSPDFRVERSLTIAAPPEALFGWFNSPKKFDEFNPWLKLDPAAKVEYTGPESGVGAVASWAGKATGKGRATIIESKPGELVRLRMDWIEPMEGVSTVDYLFKPEGGKTTVTWAMYGKSNFVGRLMSIFMSCESMCGPQFEKGLADVAKLVTTAKPAPAAQ